MVEGNRLMIALAKSSTEYYKKNANYYLRLLDNTVDHNTYMYYYDEAIWWLYLYNESRK